MLGGLEVADKSSDMYMSHSYCFISKKLKIPDQ